MEDRDFWQAAFLVALGRGHSPPRAFTIACQSCDQLQAYDELMEDLDAEETREDAQDAALHHPESDSVSHHPI